MRAIAEHVGVKAPLLYKHFPDTADLETALVAEGLRGMGEALAAAPAGLAELARAYRGSAVAHPHPYVVATSKPIDRERLPPGIEEHAAAPVLAAVGGDEHRARAVWAAAHGLVSLGLSGRFPPHADIEAVWARWSPPSGDDPANLRNSPTSGVPPGSLGQECALGGVTALTAVSRQSSRGNRCERFLRSRSRARSSSRRPQQRLRRR